MFSNSRPPNVPNPHRTQRSIIRTRSQQQQPLPSIDMSASPLKEAIRHHNHTNKNHGKSTSNQHYLEPENVRPQESGVSTDTLDDEMVALIQGKRSSSPLFPDNEGSGKRSRILRQSSQPNSPSSRQSEGFLITPRKGTTSHKPPVLKEALPHTSPSKDLVYTDLTKIPSRLLKPLRSPIKTFSVKDSDGNTIRVPITPSRRVVDEPAMNIPDTSYDPQPSLPTRLAQSPNIFVQHSTPHKESSTPTSPQQISHSVLTPMNETESHSIASGNTILPSQSGSNVTPVRPGLLGNNAIFGAPLTSSNGSPTFFHESSVPSNPLEQSPRKSTIAPSGSSFTSSDTTPIQISPTKSRIPIPSGSRLHRPPSSLAISTLVAAGPSSPVKVQVRPSPVKPKTRSKSKAYLGVRPKAPITRLAAKRGTRRTSSLMTSVALTPSKAKVDACPSSSTAVGPSYAAPTASTKEKRKSIFSNPLVFNDKMVKGNTGASSNAGSPKKPTPLTALSSALQRLKAPAPAAPAPRPRPNSNLGFTPTPSQTKQEVFLNSRDNLSVLTKTPERSWDDLADIPRSRTSLEDLRSDQVQKGLSRMGLPMRRPTSIDNHGRSGRGIDGAPFVSKQTTLSAVPASPLGSVVPPVTDIPSTRQQAAREIVDVDTWAPPNPGVNGKGEAIPTQGESKTRNVDFFVPLADEPRTKRETPPDLVSPSRRASQASLALTQSLSLPRTTSILPQARSVSTSVTTQSNPRTPVQTRNRTKPSVPVVVPAEGSKNTMVGKRSNARMPGSLDVLRDCIIFVDVRTEEGEDAAALFVDMLRGLGARILAKPGKSCTHLVYKAGLPSTVIKYKLLPEPRPLVVSIGWVVECVEKRIHVDETKFSVNLDEFGVAGGAQRRRSMQPKQMRTLSLGQLDAGESADISIRAESSFTSEEPSMPSGPILHNLSPTQSPHDNLPPLERARQRSMRLPRD